MTLPLVLLDGWELPNVSHSIEVSQLTMEREDRYNESVEFIPDPIFPAKLPSKIFAPVAQWIEHLTTDQEVTGSTPVGRTIFTVSSKLSDRIKMLFAF